MLSNLHVGDVNALLRDPMFHFPDAIYTSSVKDFSVVCGHEPLLQNLA
jgi:hypothetical protein